MPLIPRSSFSGAHEVRPGRAPWARLRPLDPSSVPLPGGSTLAVSARRSSPNTNHFRVTVREGQRVLASGLPFAFSIGAGGRIVMTRSVATDLASGRRWRPPNPAHWTVGSDGEFARACTPAGIAYGRIIAICHDLERDEIRRNRSFASTP